MRSVRARQSTTLLIASLALVCLAATVYQEFVHTDDGCQVEVHCLACRLVLGSAVGGAVAALDVGPPLVVPDRRPPESPERPPGTPGSRPSASRAPHFA